MTERRPGPADGTNDTEDAESWPAGGAPQTGDDATPEDANETGPHGEAVHQSDS